MIPGGVTETKTWALCPFPPARKEFQVALVLLGLEGLRGTEASHLCHKLIKAKLLKWFPRKTVDLNPFGIAPVQGMLKLNAVWEVADILLTLP